MELDPQTNAMRNERHLAMFGCALADLQEIAEQRDPLEVALSQLSNAQELAALGMLEESRQTINRAKWLIDATRDWNEQHPATPAPEWMTAAQVRSIWQLWKRNPDNSPNPAQFFHRVMPAADHCFIRWCDMYIGIEPDGYTHS